MTPKQQRTRRSQERGALTNDAFVRAKPPDDRAGDRQPSIGETPSAQALLQAVIDAFPGQMIVVDRDFRIVLANRAARAVSYPRAAAEGPTSPAATSHRLLFCGTTDVSDTVEEALRTRKAVTASQLRQDRGGNEATTEVTATPVLDANGDVSRVVVWSHDIAQRESADAHTVQLENQLRQAQKMEALGQFAGSVIHDFNNILTAILGNVELMQAELESELPPDDILVTGLAQIDRAGRRAATLAQQFLAYRRRELTETRAVDPNELIRDAEHMLRSLLSTRFKLQLSLAPELHQVNADAVQIEQIVINLVFSARDAMPAGGTLTVKTANVTLDESRIDPSTGAAPGPHVMIAVSHTGSASEPLVTSDQQSSPELSTVYDIVRKAKGRIVIDSEADGGTTFTVYLPASGIIIAQP